MSTSHDSMSRYVADRAPHLAAPRRTREELLAESYVTAPAESRGWKLWHLVAVAIVGALIGLWISPGRAYADPVPAEPGGVHVVRVDPAPAGPRITVTLSNGAVDVLRPCRYEDGRRCYWLAEQRGNGIGRDLVVTRGRVFYVNLHGFDPLA